MLKMENHSLAAWVGQREPENEARSSIHVIIKPFNGAQLCNPDTRKTQPD